MATLIIPDVKILGSSLVLGELKRDFADEPQYYDNDPATLRRLCHTIGFGTRQVADAATTTADLCHAAAVRLLAALPCRAEEVGAIVFVTQTPDYLMPGDAHVLHARLGLSDYAAAYDLEMGCSGYVYGLSLAAMLASHNIGKVLLLAGDTLSKMTNAKDRTTAPLFGDAGSATLLDYAPAAQPMHFLLRARGSGLEKMYVPGGGARHAEAGNSKKTDNHVHMDGFGIFDFTMREQPVALRDILSNAGKGLSDIDYVIMHQANRYIVETITRKAGIARDKAPCDIFSRYGNLNSASIPGVLCGSLARELAGRKAQVVLQGFGIGLSWGACQCELDRIVCIEPEPAGMHA